MKNSASFILALFLGVAVFAQTPQSFRYQAVARDNSGNILANQSVSFRISILSGSFSGTISYSETHTSLSTNTFGLVELEIGKGSPVTGTFSNINWGSNSYFVKIEMDPAGGSAYQVLGTSQLLSVPYALHAKTVETGDNWGNQFVVRDASLTGNGTEAQPLKIAQQSATSGQVLKWDGTTWAPANDGNGPFVSLAGITYNSNLSDHFVIGSPSVNDIEGTEDNIRFYFNKQKGAFRAGEAYMTNWDAENTGDYSVAMGYKTLATGRASTAMGSASTAAGWHSVSMGYGTLAGAINVIALGKYNVGFGNPNAWVPEDPIFEIGIGAAQAERQNAMTVLKNGKVGIGTATPTEKLEVAGQVKITGGSPGDGKVLTSNASGLASWQTPVSGFDLPLHREIASDGYVFSISNNSASAEVPKIAIMGSSDSGTGIVGSTYAGSREYAGVLGISNFIGSTGVYGKAISNSGSGIGVIGESLGDTGTGVSGNGYLHGVKGEGNKFGVRGIASGSSGIGIEGKATSETGETYGVIGKVLSPLGFSGYFEGGVFYVISNAGFGINEPTAKVDIQGQIKIRGGAPGAGKVLTADANGLATWQAPANGTFSSSSGITSNTPVTDHLVFGSSLMDDVSGTADDIRLFFNKAKGAFRAGRTSGGEWNDGLVGQFSAAFGDNNKASGTGSFASGVASVASGSTATAIGHFVNATAMLSTAVGSYNVGSGTKDSWVEADPIFEIGNGTSGAARSNAVTVLKNGSTGIGTHTPSQKLHIKGSAAGNAVLFVEPNKWTSSGDYGEVRFGDANHYIRGEHTKGMTFNDANKFSFLGGNVGIGYDNPAAKLDVSAPQGPNIIIRDSDGGSGRPGIQFVNNDIHFIGSDDTSTEIFGIYSQYGNNRTYAARLNVYGTASDNWGKYIGLTHDGNNGLIDTDAGYLVLQPAGQRVGIGTDAPTQSLDVNGNAKFRSIASDAYHGVLNRKSDGTLTTSTSDIRLKENIKNLNNSLEKVMQLRGVTFTWKTNPEYGTRIGFIAQEFEKIIPELVFTNEVDGYKGINYAEVTAVLVEAIKELKTENNLLKQRLEQIEALMEYKAEK